MNIGLKSALESRPEMGFWPAAVQALNYSHNPTSTNWQVFVILAFAGGITYHLLRRGRQFIKASKENSNPRINRRRRRRKRNRQDDEGNEKLEAVKEFSRFLLPNHQLAFWIAALGLFVNLAAGVDLFIKLYTKVVVFTNPNIAEMTLFTLPVLYVVVVFSSILWWGPD